MKHALLACMIIASLAGCSWWDRHRSTEGSGGSSPPAAQSPSPDSSNCAEPPYAPGPANCK